MSRIPLRTKPRPDRQQASRSAGRQARLKSTSVGIEGVSNGVRVRGVNGAVGPGVHGDAFSGIGVLATGRTALSVQGPAMLTVRAGRSSAPHTVINLAGTSLVLATLQQDLDGIWIRSAVPHPAGSKFTIHLNKPAPKNVKVAWFMING